MSTAARSSLKIMGLYSIDKFAQLSEQERRNLSRTLTMVKKIERADWVGEAKRLAGLGHGSSPVLLMIKGKRFPITSCTSSTLKANGVETIGHVANWSDADILKASKALALYNPSTVFCNMNLGRLDPIYEKATKEWLEHSKQRLLILDEALSKRAAQIAKCKNEIGVLNISFKTSSARIEDSQQRRLEYFTNEFSRHCAISGIRLRVHGHADTDNTKDLNVPLSEQRAKAVTTYLVTRGEFGKVAICWRGYGHEKASGDKDRDRRVDFEIE